MDIPLATPIEVTETVTSTRTASSLRADWLYVDLTGGSLRLNLQPGDREVVVEGAEFEAIRSAFSGTLAAALAPLVDRAITPPPAPQPEPAPEPQPEEAPQP